MDIKIGRYRHFKGGVYDVICIAKNSETLEDTVIYRSVSEPDKIWARPASMWCESVEYGGAIVSRFTLLE